MYILNKIVGFATNPAIVAAAAGVASAVFAHIGKARLAKIFAVAGGIWLWFWMTPVAGRMFGVPLESEFLVDGKVPGVEHYSRADAIVCLGGGMGVETNWCGYADMSPGADRVWQAARLWKAGKAPLVVATGTSVRESTAGLLADFGVPPENVVFLDEPRNTEEEAKAVRAHFADAGDSPETKTRILLVTSAWHMKRARLMFEKYAPEIETATAPADFENSLQAAKSFTPAEFFPDCTRFSLNCYALREWIAMAGYKIFR